MFNKKRVSFLFFTIIILFSMFVFAQTPILAVSRFPKDITLTQDDLKSINDNNLFGRFITVSLKEQSINTSAQNALISPELEFRLFNLIPIKSQKVTLLEDNEVLLGGGIVGLCLKSQGVVVIESNQPQIKKGDNLISINDIAIEKISDISKIISSVEGYNAQIILKRKNKEESITVPLKFDEITNSYKLGLWVKDDCSGIGTITYVKNNNRFGSLGHPIYDNDTQSVISPQTGDVYNCSVLGINKGENGKPGEIKSVFLSGKNSQGKIDKNNQFGVFGWLNDGSQLSNMGKSYEIGGRLSVRPGKAKILCSLDESGIKEYDIEIIKTNYQNYSDDRSMVIRVVDEELLNKTGGIIQGMSGSPIIQNEKLVGAVTHVFVNDSTKGFGVYIDWMINE